MSETDCHTSGGEGKERNWERVAATAHLHEYEGAREAGKSQRAFAEQAGIPRTTLQHWLERKAEIDESPAVVAFFESPEGLAVLHRVVLAAQFVTTLAGVGGIRIVCKFLELAGLDSFVAAGFGSQQRAIAEMEQAVVDFGEEEKRRLAEQMPHRSISICQDETFHPEPCLVAIEPVSNYILAEQYSSKRDAAAWTQAMDEAVEGLDVDVVQSTSDEGLGLLRHVRESLGAHHSPDIFHVQQEAISGTAGALASRVRQADKSREETERRVVRTRARTSRAFEHRCIPAQCVAGPPPPSTCLQHACGRCAPPLLLAGAHRRPRFDRLVLARALKLLDDLETYGGSRGAPGASEDHERLADKAIAEYEEAVAVDEAARQRQQQARDAVRGISESYHPFDLETGEARQADQVSSELDRKFQILGEVASEASLGERCRQRIAKAHRVVRQLVATVAFYHQVVCARVEDLGLPAEAETLVHRNLIPGLYIQQVAAKAKGTEARAALRERATSLLAPVDEPDSPLSLLDDDDRITVNQVALDCAQLFQRSSSCVEGRNGQLSLRHHSLHRLLPRKLKAVTVVHNFFIPRPDATTAAERFFVHKPRKLFDALLNKLDVPRRPAAARRIAA